MKWISVFLLFHSIVICGADKPDYADSLFAKGHYFDAITEYKRYVFHNPGSEVLDSIFMQIGISYRHLGEYENSERYLKTALIETESPAMTSRIYIEKAINSLILRETDSASVRLQKALFDNDQDNINQIYFYFIVMHVLDSDYESAREYFTHYALSVKMDQESEPWFRMQKLFDSVEQMKQKNVRRAKWLSTFLPGSGQIYCEAWFNGTIAFFLNTSLFILTGSSLLNAKYLDAVVFGYFLRLFYTGNRIRTELICIDFNNDIQMHYQQKILLELYSMVLTEEVKIKRIN